MYYPVALELLKNFEILSWSQMGLHKKPIGLLNINGFFDPLENLLDGCIQSGFAPKENKNLFIIEKDPESLIKNERFSSYNAK